MRVEISETLHEQKKKKIIENEIKKTFFKES